MDSTPGHAPLQDPGSTASKGHGPRCAVRVDGLTLLTAVIALAGFVGTAAFAAPIECTAQAAPSAATAG
jgi:hypothetical protein